MMENGAELGSRRCSSCSARAGTAGERPPSGSRNPAALNSKASSARESNAGAPRLWCRRSAELLGEADEKPFRPANVAEPIRVFITHYFAYELRAVLAELLERLVDVVHGEHDA